MFNKDTYEVPYPINEIEDEIDCAILDDDTMNDALDKMSDPNFEFKDCDDDDLDVFMDYSGDVVSPTVDDMDAAELIATERELLHDPFEDDDIIDLAIGDDAENIDISDDDDSTEDVDTSDVSMDDLID